MGRILRTELEDKPGYWHLDEDVQDGAMFVPIAFIWDLATKPTVGKKLGYTANDPHTEKASLYHDLIYIDHRMTRAQADKLYREQSIKDGYPKRKAWVEWAAIRMFGGSHWANDKEDLKLVSRMCQTWYKMGGKYAEFADYMIKACGI